MKLTGKACKALDASNALCIATALRAAAATRRSACNSSGAVGSAQHQNQRADEHTQYLFVQGAEVDTFLALF
jgi:hypothetical protein